MDSFFKIELIRTVADPQGGSWVSDTFAKFRGYIYYIHKHAC